jgi:hypothetical protein
VTSVAAEETTVGHLCSVILEEVGKEGYRPSITFFIEGFQKEKIKVSKPEDLFPRNAIVPLGSFLSKNFPKLSGSSFEKIYKTVLLGYTPSYCQLVSSQK